MDNNGSVASNIAPDITASELYTKKSTTKYIVTPEQFYKDLIIPITLIGSGDKEAAKVKEFIDDHGTVYVPTFSNGMKGKIGVTFKHKWLARHCATVGLASAGLAYRLRENGFSEGDLTYKGISHILVAGFLHDYKKDPFDEELLKSPNITEYQKMMLADHVMNGAEYARKLLGNENIASIIEYHHKCAEKEYREEAPLGSHIILLPNNLDNLIMKTYRENVLGMEEALELMKKQDKYIPDIFEVFLEVVENEKFMHELYKDTEAAHNFI